MNSPSPNNGNSLRGRSPISFISHPTNLIRYAPTSRPIIFPKNIRFIRSNPLPYLNYPISQIQTDRKPPFITIYSPRNNKINIIGSRDQNEIDKLAKMADQSGSKEEEINIVIGSPPQSPAKDLPTHQCLICVDKIILEKDLIKCCKQAICSTCIGKLPKLECPFCRKPLEGVGAKVAEKIEQVHQQGLTETRMGENFFDKMGSVISQLAMAIGNQRQSQAILLLFTSVAALKYDNAIPKTHQERQILIDILIQKIAPFNSLRLPNHIMEVQIGEYIITITSQVQEEEAIKQSKDFIENETVFKDLSLLVKNFALQLENISTQPNPVQMRQLQDQVRSISKSTTISVIMANRANKDALVDQIYSKLSSFNQIGMSEKLIRDKISELIQLQISKIS